jgi:hypothetical protein
VHNNPGRYAVADPTILDHVLISLIAAFLIYGGVWGRRQLREMTFDTAAKLSVYWANGIVLWIGAAAVCGVWWLGGRPLADLGLTWHH